MAKSEYKDVSIIGIPFDENSSFVRGTSLAPLRIRQAFHSPPTNLFSEDLTDLGSIASLSDLGDLNFSEDSDEFSLTPTTVRKSS
jgi:arginase family enzyme